MLVRVGISSEAHSSGSSNWMLLIVSIQQIEIIAHTSLPQQQAQSKMLHEQIQEENQFEIKFDRYKDCSLRSFHKTLLSIA
jgi:hypothetical protein